MDIDDKDFVPRTSDGTTAGQYLRRLRKAPSIGGGFERGRSVAAPEATPDLSGDDVDALVDRLEQKLKTGGSQKDDLVTKRAVIIAEGKNALKKLSTEGADADLTETEQFGTEAVIIASGERPTLSVESGVLDLEDAELGQWDQITRDWQDRIETIAKSVGRIDLAGRHMGTGWVCADGRVMTNRHVLQVIADHNTDDGWKLKDDVTICFDGANRFAITPEIVFGGAPAAPQRSVDFAHIDAAILTCDTGGAVAFPEPLTMETKKSWIVEARNVYAMGFPAKPRPHQEKFAVLMEIFQMEFGVKRYAPGEIDTNLGGIPSDPNDTVFAHDCSTLAGNSGSPMVDLGNEGRAVVGLHFAGLARHGNFAHSVAALKEHMEKIGAAFV